MKGISEKKLDELAYYFDGYGSSHDVTILRLIKLYKKQKEAIEKLKIIPKEVHSSSEHVDYMMGILSKLDLGRDLE